MKIRYLLNNLGDRIPPQSPNSLGESGTPPKYREDTKF